MIPEVEGLGVGGPRGKGSLSVSKGPKLHIPTTIAVAEKQSKRSKKGPFSLSIGSPPGPTQEMELMGPGGEGPSWSTPVSPAMQDDIPLKGKVTVILNVSESSTECALVTADIVYTYPAVNRTKKKSQIERTWQLTR